MAVTYQRLTDGSLKTKYYPNTSETDYSKWHDTFQEGDLYMIVSENSGATWGSPCLIVGEDGYNSKDISLYQRADTPPSPFTGSLDYDFETDILSGSFGLWSRYPSDVSEDNRPLYTVSGTARSRTTTATISNWSKNVTRLTNTDLSTDDVQSISGKGYKISRSADKISIRVDKNRKVTRQSTYCIDISCTHNDVNVPIQFGAVTLPSGFTFNSVANQIRITIASGTVINEGTIEIPVLIKKVLVDVNYKDTNSSTVTNKNIYGDGSSAYSAPTYTEDDTETVVISYDWVEGGVNFGAISTVTQIPSDPYPEDFFVWTGENATITASTSVSTQTFTVKKYVIYTWNGNEWVESDTLDQMNKSLDILLEANNKETLENNDSQVVKFFDKVVVNGLFVDKLVANEGFIGLLGTRQLTVKEGGLIKSEEYDEETEKGFLMKSDGTLIARGAQFDNVSVKGEIEATSLKISSGASVEGLGVSNVDGLQSNLDDKSDKTSTVSSITYYYKSTDSSTAPAAPTEASRSDWTTSVPALTDKNYIWECRRTAYISGSPQWDTNVQLYASLGALSDYAKDNDLINSITTYFYCSKSSTKPTTKPATVPTGTWSSSSANDWYKNPAVDSSWYCWSCTYTDYKDSSKTKWGDILDYSKLKDISDSIPDISNDIKESQKIYYKVSSADAKTLILFPPIIYIDNTSIEEKTWTKTKITPSDGYYVYSCIQYLTNNNTFRSTMPSIDTESVIDTSKGYLRMTLIDAKTILANNIELKKSSSQYIKTEGFNKDDTTATSGFLLDGGTGKIYCNSIIAKGEITATKLIISSSATISDSGKILTKTIDTDELFAKTITMKGDDSIIKTEGYDPTAVTQPNSGYMLDGANGKIYCNNLIANGGSFYGLINSNGLNIIGFTSGTNYSLGSTSIEFVSLSVRKSKRWVSAGEGTIRVEYECSFSIGSGSGSYGYIYLNNTKKKTFTTTSTDVKGYFDLSVKCEDIIKIEFYDDARNPDSTLSINLKVSQRNDLLKYLSKWEDV